MGFVMVERDLNREGTHMVWKCVNLLKYILKMNPNLKADQKEDIEIALSRLSKFQDYSKHYN